MVNDRTIRWLVLLLLLLGSAGCAAQTAYQKAEKSAQRQNWDRAVLEYSKALSFKPGNSRYGVALERAKLKASAQHFDKGRKYQSAAQWELASTEFQQTLLLNPGNQHAATELKKVLSEIQKRDEEPSRIEQLKAEARRRDLAPPMIDASVNMPIVVMFKDQPVQKIFDALSKASGINFLYDDKVDLKKNIDIDLGSVTMRKALDILMLQTKNFYKVLDENTLLIAPDQRPKRQEYEDHVIRTFYLSNGDTKQVVTLLRTLLNSRQIAENQTLNSVTIKDTPDKVAIAEKIIQANDKSKGEVVVDVELIEIDRTITQNLGIDLSSKTLAVTFGDGEESVSLNNLNILKQAGNWALGPIPSVVINFLKSDSDARVIAKPQLRVSEGEQAEILIGDRVPIPTTSFNTSQTVGGNIVPITSFTYQNVGITVQIEPRVHHNKEVTLKVQVEISQVTGAVETGAGQAQPIIGTRNISTVIRLRDGETNMLAGLIKEESQDTRTGVAGISDIPGLNKILANNNRSKTTQDIILTLTPRIIRIPDITADDLATLWVGTEENMRLRIPADSGLAATPFDNGESDEETSAAAAAAAALVDDLDDPLDPETISDTGGDASPDDADAAADRDARQSGGPTLIRLVPSATQYRVGDRVVVQVVADNAVNLGSAPFHLRYDRSVLEFLPPGIKGPLLENDGRSAMFLASDSAAGGEVVVGLSRMGGGEGVSGSGVLATFEFQAVNPGDASFSFIGASLKGPRAENLPASFLPTAVKVVP